MKKSCIFIFLLLLLISTGCNQNPKEEISPNTIAEDIEKGSFSSFSANLIPSSQQVLEQLTGASVYEIEVELLPEESKIMGKQTVQYTNHEEAALNEIYFRMYPNNSNANMKISNVLVDDAEVNTAVDFENTALRVDLPDPLIPGKTITMQMDFSAELPKEFGGNYGLFGFFEESVIALDQFYPSIPVFDDEGWNVEVPPPNGDMIYHDPAFFSVTVTAPEDYVIAASGVQIAEEMLDGKQSLTFIFGPGRDFYIAASPNYVSSSEQVGETLVTSYFPASMEEGGKLVLETAVNALESYNARFGVYPYTELDLVGTPMKAGGMEYSGIVVLALGFYDPSQLVSGTPAFVFLESATAHEVAHEWFFNMVMSDQIDEPWIDEGMVQFMTYLYYVDTYGDQAASQYRESWDYRWDRVGFDPVPIGKPAGDYTQKEYGAIIYGRAPLFIYDLMQKMDPDKFDTFLRELFLRNQWGIINTDDFKNLVEEICECDFTAEFKNWVYER